MRRHGTGGWSRIGAVIAAVVMLVLSSPVSRAAATAGEPVLEVRAAAITGDATTTVIALETSRIARAEAFVLTTPARLVVDLPAARFDLPAGAGAGGGLVAAWRWGSVVAGRGRVVFDLSTRARIARAEWVPSTFFGNDRLVIEVTAASDGPAASDSITVLPPGESTATAAAPKADRAALPVHRGRPVVVIDAGHGGLDAGTVSPATGTPEKTVVLAVARQLAERLRRGGRYDVVMTRDDDHFVGLGERVKMARAAGADLFLSIHADAEYDHSVRGATVYTLAEKASDAQAAALAVKENQSDAIAGLVGEDAPDEVADILADLTLRETRRLSHALARDVLAEYGRWGHLVKSSPHRRAGLRVLRAHDIPSALVEIGFLSNKDDEALITSADGRARIADVLARAVDRWFADRTAPGEGRAAEETGSTGPSHDAASLGAVGSP